MGKQSREKRTRKNEIGKEKSSPVVFQAGLEKVCLLIITWGTYLVLFTPLIVNTKFFFPFVAPKTIFFRMVIEIILAAYLFLVIAHKVYRPRINLLTIAVTLYLSVFILASFAGINLERSFWSTNERMTGILTMLHLFAFFIILTSVFKERKEWEKVLGVSIIVGVILSLYVLIEEGFSVRGGTVGNTSFMAAYLLFDVFFAIIFLLAKRGAWQIFAGACLVITLPVLLISTARGAIAAFFGGLFLLGLGYLIFSQKKALKRVALGIILALIIFGITSAVIQPPFVKDKISTVPVDMKSRIVVWESGWKGFLERPVLGWGPENFNNVFLKYYNPCMLLDECGSEATFDRVHNIVLDTLVTTGIIGLLSYLFIFGVAIFGLLRAASKAVERKNVFIPLGLAVLLLVYFFQNLLIFDAINTYLVFFLSLGLVSFLTQKHAAEEKQSGRKVNPILGFLPIAVMIFILWTTNIQPAVANYYIVKMIDSQKVVELSYFFQKSLDSWMNKYETREYFSRKIARSAYQEISDEHRKSFQQAFELAESEMEKSRQENPLDPRLLLSFGKFYNGFYLFSRDVEKLKKAEEILEKAIQLSPNNQQGYWYLAEIKALQGKIAETIPPLKTALGLEPRLGLAHWYLASAYNINGDYQLALNEVMEMYRVGYFWWMEEPERASIYQIVKKENPGILTAHYAELVEFFSGQLERGTPNRAGAWAVLYASYTNLGQFEKAKEAADRVKELNPDLIPKVEELLKVSNG